MIFFVGRCMCHIDSSHVMPDTYISVKCSHVDAVYVSGSRVEGVTRVLTPVARCPIITVVLQTFPPTQTCTTDRQESCPLSKVSSLSHVEMSFVTVYVLTVIRCGITLAVVFTVVFLSFQDT